LELDELAERLTEECLTLEFDRRALSPSFVLVVELDREGLLLDFDREEVRDRDSPLRGIRRMVVGSLLFLLRLPEERFSDFSGGLRDFLDPDRVEVSFLVFVPSLARFRAILCNFSLALIVGFDFVFLVSFVPCSLLETSRLSDPDLKLVRVEGLKVVEKR